MSKYLVKSPYIDEIKHQLIRERITPELKAWLDDELFYMECRHETARSWLELKKQLAGKKAKNPNQSALAYVLGLTDEKPSAPVKKVLGSLPDIDYDSSNRDAVKQYVVKKYGVDRSGLIGTYQSLALKGSLKDTIRQFADGKVSAEEANEISRELDVVRAKDFAEEADADRAHIEAAMETSPKLKKWFQKWPQIQEVLLKMVGTFKSSGIHASGIVISDKPLYEVCPANFDKDEGLYVTQPQMADVEYLGLIKFDFLGLTTLEIFKMCFDLVKSRRGIQLSLDKIPLDDKTVYDAISSGHTAAMFQFEGEGITNAIKLIKPTTIADLSAINALYRPGPMDQIPRYAARKHGKEEVTYPHQVIKSVLEETYGVLVYQEQIMELAIHLGGLTGSEGYALIKSISKKDAKKIESFRERFCAGAKAQKLSEKHTDDLWRSIMKFAEYGFNKSHAAAYAVTGYICAWLYEYYKPEFIASVLTMADKDKFEHLYPLWKAHLLSPSIQHSSSKYEIVGDKIAMPIDKIAKVGEQTVPVLTKNRPYNSFMDFLTKNENEKISKTVVKNLIFSGAMDDFKLETQKVGQFRFDLYEQFIAYTYGIEPRTKEEIENGISLSSRKKKPSKSLLEDESELERIRGMGKTELVNMEISLLGFSTFNYHSFYGELGHKKAVNLFGEKVNYMALKEVTPDLNEKVVCVIACVSEIEIIRIRKEGRNFGREMVMMKVSEDDKIVNVTVFPDLLEKDDKAGGYLRKITPMTPIIIRGKVNLWGDDRRLSIILDDARILK